MESTTSSHDAPTAVQRAQPALATVAGDQCTNCGAPLAPDQRYCVQCGQRRGQSRMPAAQPVPAVPVVRESRAPRLSHNAALIAGVGTLLLAMGVGVLIGRSGQKTASSSAGTPQVITVGGSGNAANTAAAAGAAAGAAKGAKKATVKSTGKKATAAQAQQAADKIKGTSLKLPKKAVVKVGQPGHGPGYQNGKFTGNFFGGG